MKYVHPITKKVVKRSTGTADPREAPLRAAQWELELNEGKYKPRSKETWQDLRRDYEKQNMLRERRGSYSNSSIAKFCSVADAFEAFCHPKFLREITGRVVEAFQQSLRQKGLKETTIRSNIATLARALRWAEADERMEAPRICLPIVTRRKIPEKQKLIEARAEVNRLRAERRQWRRDKKRMQARLDKFEGNGK
jgi:hypothetical protein